MSARILAAALAVARYDHVMQPGAFERALRELRDAIAAAEVSK